MGCTRVNLMHDPPCTKNTTSVTMLLLHYTTGGGSYRSRVVEGCMSPRTTWHPRADMDVARRSDGWCVARGGGTFWLLPLRAGSPLALRAQTLTEAVQEADEFSPPEGWWWTGSAWMSEAWQVAPVEGGWAVCTPEGSRVVRRVHPQAHGARAWADVRRDRAGRALRGPLPTKRA